MATSSQRQRQAEAEQRRREAEIAAAFAAASTAVAAVPLFLPILLPLGLSRGAVVELVHLLYSWTPPERYAGFGAAGHAARRQAIIYRAAYLLNAARRVATAGKAARSAGGSLRDVVAAERAALTRERGYYRQHLAAQQGRVRAAANVDFIGLGHPLLAWRTHVDDRTTPECLAADKGTFTVTDPPVIGWPGAAHARCRCWAVPGQAGAATVNELLARAGIIPSTALRKAA